MSNGHALSYGLQPLNQASNQASQQASYDTTHFLGGLRVGEILLPIPSPQMGTTIESWKHILHARAISQDASGEGDHSLLAHRVKEAIAKLVLW